MKYPLNIGPLKYFIIIIITVTRGGGKKQSGRHHPPTLKSSLRASRICYSFFQGGLGKKVMRYQSWGGGGGGSWPKKIKKKKFITFLNFYFGTLARTTAT